MLSFVNQDIGYHLQVCLTLTLANLKYPHHCAKLEVRLVYFLAQTNNAVG